MTTFAHGADQAAIEDQRNCRRQDHRQDDVAGGGNDMRGDQRGDDAGEVVQCHDDAAGGAGVAGGAASWARATTKAGTEALMSAENGDARAMAERSASRTV